MKETKTSAMLPILNYHGIEARNGEYSWEAAEKDYVLAASVFEEQLDYLRDNGFCALSLSGLRHWLGGKNDAARPVVLTFDDGLTSHYDYARPCLKKRNLPAIFFVSAGLVGRRGQMDWKELRAMTADGFEIGSHGFSHVPLTGLSESKLTEELKRSKETLEDGLRVPVLGFSIPKGFYHPRIRPFAERAGYQFLFTSQYELNPVGQDRLCLKRLVVKSGISAASFARMLAGEAAAKIYWEQLKDSARQMLPPKLYEAAAGIKRKLALR